jgi:uncharacterized protein YegL
MRRRLFLHYINLGDTPPGPELAINIVVDDSGSMSGAPILAVRAALKDLIETMPEAARIGLIAFGSQVAVLAEPTEYREFLLDQIERFQADSGSTMLWDAVGEACRRFADDSRHRYVLVLTDGGDTGSGEFSLSDQPTTKTSLIEFAARNRAAVFAIGFGNADRSGLERLAASTGGAYFDAGDVSHLVDTLRKAVAAILKDRREVKLRPEVTRLLGRSFGGGTPWLRQISFDEWGEPETWLDDSHVRFPAPSEKTIDAYRAWFDRERSRLRQLLEDQIRAQSAAGLFPEDLDIVVAGWLHDPAFRALSPLLLDLLGVAQERLAASLPGGRYPLLIPLVHEAGMLAAADAADCHAWLTACRNAGGARAPKAVLVCGDTNLHRVLNPHGYAGRDRRTVLHQAANTIRALALDPGTVTRLVGYQADGGWPLRSVGTTTVDTGFGSGRRRQMVEALDASITAFVQRTPTREREHDTATRRFRDSGLTVEHAKDRVFAAPEPGSPQGILANVHLQLSDFWPPPPSEPLESYLARLPRMIAERGSETLARKLELLRRTSGRRFNDLFSESVAGVATDVDRYCFGRDDAGVGPAHLYCELLVEMIASQAAEVSADRGDATGALRWLFVADEAAVGSAGTRTPEDARRDLEELIRHRPLAEGFALRYGSASLVAGLVVYRLTGVVQGVFGLASLMAPTASGIAVVAVAGAGYLLWRRYWVRLRAAIREYIASLVRAAREAAVRDALDALRRFYDRLTRWLGTDSSVPALSPGATRSEETLSERQRLTVLAERLQFLAQQYRRQLEDNLPPANPFVLESGRVSDQIAAGLPAVTIPPDPDAARLSIPWSSVALFDENRRWREVCRRKRCDSLAEFLAFHEERLTLPARLQRRLETAAETSQHDARRVCDTLGPERFRDWDSLLRVLQALAFPPLRLGEAPAVAPADGRWLVHPDEITRLRNATGISDAVQEALRLAADPIEPTWELHHVLSESVPVERAADWSRFASEFRCLDIATRREVLVRWGNPASWLDVETGAPCVDSEPEGTTSDDAGGEGL